MCRMKAAIALLAFAVAASALPQDPIAWTAPLRNTNLPTSAQLYASNADGVVVVLDNNSFVCLDGATGSVRWALLPPSDLSAQLAVYAVSSTTFFAAVPDPTDAGASLVFGYDLTTMALVGRVEVFGAFTAVQVHMDFAVVSGSKQLVVFASDMTQRFASNTNGMSIQTIGATGGLVYYLQNLAGGSSSSAASSSSFEGTAADSFAADNLLVVVSVDDWSSYSVDNIIAVSASGASSTVVAVYGSNDGVAALNLNTRKTKWVNNAIGLALGGVFDVNTLFYVSVDIVVLIAVPYVVALDGTTGDVFFNTTTSASSVVTPIAVADGRLVYGVDVGLSSSPLTILSQDVTTGFFLGNISTPTISTPSVAFVGGAAIVANGQGYERVSVVSLTPLSYSMSLPGTTVVAALRGVPAAGNSTVLLVGSVGVSAFVLAN